MFRPYMAINRFWQLDFTL